MLLPGLTLLKWEPASAQWFPVDPGEISVKKKSQTRMHSSRMRTGRSLTVCRGLLPGGVYLVPEGVLSPGGCTYSQGGVSSPRGVWFQEVSVLGVGGVRVSALGGVSAPGGVPGAGGVYLVWGVSALGGFCSRGYLLGGVSAPGGSLLEVVSQHALRQTPPL